MLSLDSCFCLLEQDPAVASGAYDVSRIVPLCCLYTWPRDERDLVMISPPSLSRVSLVLYAIPSFIIFCFCYFVSAPALLPFIYTTLNIVRIRVPVALIFVVRRSLSLSSSAI
jgi:hypothetical protein